MVGSEGLDALEDGVEAGEQRRHEAHPAERPRQPAEEGKQSCPPGGCGEVVEVGAHPRCYWFEAELDAREQATKLRAGEGPCA